MSGLSIPSSFIYKCCSAAESCSEGWSGGDCFFLRGQMDDSQPRPLVSFPASSERNIIVATDASKGHFEEEYSLHLRNCMINCIPFSTVISELCV